LNRILKNIFLLFSVLIQACSTYNSLQYQKEIGVKLADTLATEQTVNLFFNLQKLSNSKTIFGHHHSTAYGVGWEKHPDRSDIKDIINTYPGLYGWDFGIITSPSNFYNDWMKRYVIEAYNRGGVNTFCWHYFNPLTGNSFYDTTITVKEILVGGKAHQNYLNDLDRIAEYTRYLTNDDRESIPIIFRPFHEFDGSWFWWGKHFCTKDEYVSLWRFTVDYLKSKGVNSFLYAYSPDRNFCTEEEFLERYPGDDYVDIVGMDNYFDFTEKGDGFGDLLEKLRIVTDVAIKKNKIAALTETGLESIPDSCWWTDQLLRALESENVKMAYVMLWRNANDKHHYAPYKGHKSEKNFIEFSKSPLILFENNLPDLYNHLLEDDDFIKKN